MLAMTAGCELEVERGPDWLLVSVRSFEPGSAFADQLLELAENHFIYRIVLELHHLDILDDDTIEALVHLNRHIHEHEGVLRICGLSVRDRRALEQQGLADLCLAYDTRDEAIEGCCRSRLPR